MLLNVEPAFGTVWGIMNSFRSLANVASRPWSLLFLFAALALGQRQRGAGNCEDGDRRGDSNRDRKSAGQDQSF